MRWERDFSSLGGFGGCEFGRGVVVGIMMMGMRGEVEDEWKGRRDFR